VSCERVGLLEDLIGGLCRGYRALAVSVIALRDRIWKGLLSHSTPLDVAMLLQGEVSKNVPLCLEATSMIQKVFIEFVEKYGVSTSPHETR